MSADVCIYDMMYYTGSLLTTMASQGQSLASVPRCQVSCVCTSVPERKQLECTWS